VGPRDSLDVIIKREKSLPLFLPDMEPWSSSTWSAFILNYLTPKELNYYYYYYY